MGEIIPLIARDTTPPEQRPTPTETLESLRDHPEMGDFVAALFGLDAAMRKVSQLPDHSFIEEGFDFSIAIGKPEEGYQYEVTAGSFNEQPEERYVVIRQVPLTQAPFELRRALQLPSILTTEEAGAQMTRLLTEWIGREDHPGGFPVHVCTPLTLLATFLTIGNQVVEFAHDAPGDRLRIVFGNQRGWIYEMKVQFAALSIPGIDIGAKPH